MRRFAAGLLSVFALSVCFGCGAPSGDAQTDGVGGQIDTVEGHLAAAQAAAGQEHTGLFDRVCTQAESAAARRAGAASPSQSTSAASAGPAAAAAPPGPPLRSEWYAEPVRVFDNLYFVGQTEYTAWAVTTSEGIIIIDPIFEYSVEAEIVEGLTKLGLDPGTIRYVLVSHGHRDHVGGARFLQDRGARVILGAGDWDLLESNTGDWPKPQRDIVAEDAQELRLGDTTLRLYLTPGHTPGTISTLIPLTDGGRTHVAALWGGTAFNFMGRPGEDMWFREYIRSAQRFRDIAVSAGADVLISNHSNFDGSETKLPALAQRAPGQPHPYVVGTESVQRYLTVAQECAQAGLLAVSQQ